jgi:hypothetical protein
MVAVVGLLGGLLVVIGLVWRAKEMGSRDTAGRSPDRRRQPDRRRSSGTKRLQWKLKTEEANPPETISSSALAQSPRRSARVVLKLPLEVSGIDLEGRSFNERSHTLVINRNGASIALRNSTAPGARIKIKNLQTSQTCKFRVCEGTEKLPGGLREWGVDCVDPAPNFWGISFPETPQDSKEETIGSLLECTGCHCREMTKLSLSDYRTTVRRTSLARFCTWCGKETEWKFAVVVEDAGETASPALKEAEEGGSLPPGGERRRDERRIARLPISIRHEDGREEFTTTENVSRSGVCCAATMQLAVGDHVFLRLVSDQGTGEVEFRAEIRWRRRINEKRGNLYGMKMERD